MSAATLRHATADTAPAWVTACTDTCPDCATAHVAPELWAIRGDCLICGYQCGCGSRWAMHWGVSSAKPVVA